MFLQPTQSIASQWLALDIIPIEARDNANFVVFKCTFVASVVCRLGIVAETPVPSPLTPGIQHMEMAV